MADLEFVIKIPEGLKNDFESEQWTALSCMEMKDALEKAKPLSEIIDNLKKFSKDHRHNYVGNSREERAWRLGIEDSIDLILAGSEE